jgi:hypothetical protein
MPTITTPSSQPLPAAFDYDIATEQRVIPAVPGVYNFVATIACLYKSANGAKTRIPSPVGEAWGETEEQARQAMEAKVQQWITDQDGTG